MNIETHYLAILLSGIASMVIGFLRYSPMLFGKSWMQLTGDHFHILDVGGVNIAR